MTDALIYKMLDTENLDINDWFADVSKADNKLDILYRAIRVQHDALAQISKDYSELEEEHMDLQSEYKDLEDKFGELQDIIIEARRLVEPYD